MTKEKRAFLTDLFDTYYNELLRIAEREIRRKGYTDYLDQARTCVKSVFVAADKDYEQLKDRENIRGWMYKALNNRIKSSTRDRIQDIRRHLLMPMDEMDFADPQNQIDAWIEMDTNKMLLGQIFSQVSERDDRICRAFYEEDNTAKQIAKREGLPLSTVKGIVERFRNNAKKQQETFYG